jgi:DNA-directed RNA polymerase subunit RPC12/RpoP
MNEARKKAKKNYQSKVKRFTVDFYPTEADIYEQLQKQPKKQTYIKNLIRADIEKKENIDTFGEWIPIGDWLLACSECDGTIQDKDTGVYPRYCEHCGHKMLTYIKEGKV